MCLHFNMNDKDQNMEKNKPQNQYEIRHENVKAIELREGLHFAFQEATLSLDDCRYQHYPV